MLGDRAGVAPWNPAAPDQDPGGFRGIAMNKLTLVLGAALLAASFGCAGESSTEAPTGDSAVATVNSSCPVGNKPVVADGGTVTFQGQAIGFCCSDCADTFQGWTDAEKVAALAKVGVELPQ